VANAVAEGASQTVRMSTASACSSWHPKRSAKIPFQAALIVGPKELKAGAGFASRRVLSPDVRSFLDFLAAEFRALRANPSG
jgi:hypothetical protein